MIETRRLKNVVIFIQRFIYKNLRFAFNEMKFIELIYIQQTKFRCNKIYNQKHSAERKI